MQIKKFLFFICLLSVRIHIRGETTIASEYTEISTLIIRVSQVGKRLHL